MSYFFWMEFKCMNDAEEFLQEKNHPPLDKYSFIKKRLSYIPQC